MKVEVSNLMEPSEFPRLMISSSGIVVLFASKDRGTVLVTNTSSYFSVGDYREDWCIENFTDFHGTLTLSNGE